MSVPYITDPERGVSSYCPDCHVALVDHTTGENGELKCPIDKALARRPSGGPYEEDPEDEW